MLTLLAQMRIDRKNQKSKRVALTNSDYETPSFQKYFALPGWIIGFA
jgi:hypothetical protein